MNPIQIHLSYFHKVPLFVTPTQDNDLSRVFGGDKDKRTSLTTFPATEPFASIVLKDLQVVFGDRLVFSPEASAFITQLEELKEAAAAQTLPSTFEYHTTPFEHQKEAVLRALYEPRTGILFDCGLGKTKTVIDILSAARELNPKMKTLVVVPPHLPRNWAREFEIHAPGKFRVCVFLDKNNKTSDWQTRRHIYKGTRDKDPVPGTWAALVYPDIHYLPLENPPEDLAALEREYLELVNKDEDRTKIRGQMQRLAKKYDVAVTPAAKKLEPTPRAARDYDVVVISTSVLEGSEDVELILKYVPYDAIVFDESHAFRSPSSKRSKAAIKLAERVDRRHIMTGTPALGDPMHMFAQLSIIGEFLVGGWYAFRKRYVVLRQVDRYGKTYDESVAYKALNVLNEIVSMSALRKRAEDCVDLPPVRVIDYVIDVSETTKELYNQMATDSAVGLAEDQPNVMAAHAADRNSKLFQILGGFVYDSGKNYKLCEDCPHLMDCVRDSVKPYTQACHIEKEAPPKTTTRTGCTAKRDGCADLVDTILNESDSKVIVWAVYSEELEMLSEVFTERGYSFVRVDGSTKDKVAAEDAFNNDPECRVYLAQIATGVGITLTSANYTIYYNVSFDLSEYEQSRKRNERISQKRSVTVYHLLVPGSVTDYIFRSLRRKQEISDSITTHIACSVCALSEKCAVESVRPFSEDCLYSTKGSKVRVRPALLE